MTRIGVYSCAKSLLQRDLAQSRQNALAKLNDIRMDLVMLKDLFKDAQLSLD